MAKTKPPAPLVELWGQSVPLQLGIPENLRDFEIIRLARRIEELEADKNNLLENLKVSKRALQDHQTFWSIYLREKIGPNYIEARRLQLACESAIGRLDQLSNGPATYELLPVGHPFRKQEK